MTTTAYDNLQRRTSLTQPDPDGGGSLTSPVTTWEYGASTHLVGIVDPLGHETTYAYDDYGRLASETNELGYTTAYAYNLLDQISSITRPDPDGAGSLTAPVTTYEYDYLNRRDAIIDASSGETRFTFDVGGQLLSLEDAVGNVTQWAYDNLGRVTMETNELNDTRSFWYDPVGNQTRRQDRNGRVTQNVFDNLDRLTAENWLTGGDPVPELTIATTTQGGPVSEVQRVGATGFYLSGTFTLSFGGQTTGNIAISATAATVQTALEGLSSIGSGNISVVKLQDTANAHEWRLTFGGSLVGANQSQVTIDTTNVTTMMGPPTKIETTDTQGSTGSAEVQVVTLSNATGGVFRLAFGGQTTAELDHDASASEVDSALEDLSSIGSGNVSVSGSSGGPWTITFGGALAGLDVAQLQGDSSTAQSGSVANSIEFVYDVASQLTSAGDSDSALGYTYDDLGRTLTVSNAGTTGVPTVVLTAAYNAASSRTQLRAEIGSADDFENNYTLDNLQRQTKVEQVGQSGGNAVAEKRLDFAYNGASFLTSVVREYKPSSTWTEVATTAYSYDDLYRVTGIDHKQGGTSLFTPYSYTYDNIDRITDITSQDGTVAYAYDPTSQLTSADYSYQTDQSFSFDANGNWTMSGYSTGTNNQMTSDGVYNYEYDDEGNLTKRTKISDGSYTEYGWDHRQRLTSITNRNSSHTVLSTVSYVYDAFNRRITKSFDADGPGGNAAVDTHFVYDVSGTSVLLEFDGSNNLLRRNLWAEPLDQLLAVEDDQGDILWRLSDHARTVRDLLDSTGTVQNHLKFDANANVTSETAASVDYLMGALGMVRDEETGLSYAWNRYQGNGHWLSPDPLGFTAGDPNLQRVTGNDPINKIDPTGLVGKGHHKVNQANWAGLSAAAISVFDGLGATDGLGPTIWNQYYVFHNGSTVNGISHDQYNKEIWAELDKYLKEIGKPGAKMTADEATEFLKKINKSENPIISAFNAGVEAEAKAALKAGKAAQKAAEKSGLSPEDALKKAKIKATEAGKALQETLNGKAAKKAAAIAADSAGAATKIGGKAAAKGAGKTGLKVLLGSLPVVGGLFGGGSTLAETGDVNASLREVALDATPIGVAVDVARIGVVYHDHVEVWQAQSAEYYQNHDPRFQFP